MCLCENVGSLPFWWSHGRRPCAAVSKAILNVESDVSNPPLRLMVRPGLLRVPFGKRAFTASVLACPQHLIGATSTSIHATCGGRVNSMCHPACVWEPYWQGQAASVIDYLQEKATQGSPVDMCYLNWLTSGVSCQLHIVASRFS